MAPIVCVRHFVTSGRTGTSSPQSGSNTNPHNPRPGITIEIGSNWENCGRNRAKGASRLSIRLADATLTADGRALVENGAILWDRVESLDK